LVRTLQSANPEWLQEGVKSRTIVRPLFASGFALCPHSVLLPVERTP
jgi:hypothetical protein